MAMQEVTTKHMEPIASPHDNAVQEAGERGGGTYSSSQHRWLVVSPQQPVLHSKLTQYQLTL